MGQSQMRVASKEMVSAGAPIDVVFDKMCDARLWFSIVCEDDDSPQVSMTNPGAEVRRGVPGEGAEWTVLRDDQVRRSQRRGDYVVSYTENVKTKIKVNLQSVNKNSQLVFHGDQEGSTYELIFDFTTTSQNRTQITITMDARFCDPCCGLLKVCCAGAIRGKMDIATTKLQFILDKEVGNGIDARMR
eukprot:TRINITY_DN447_c0_g1_i1.p2 TRINITY_DN447_c0_g1~~TRINITY_DN447_c0_g1_i1.p2  ORF type:complete len:188 (+),score=74.18 TRINITY_DN447_c0_g1_i1:75-638(+)